MFLSAARSFKDRLSPRSFWEFTYFGPVDFLPESLDVSTRFHDRMDQPGLPKFVNEIRRLVVVFNCYPLRTGKLVITP